MKRFFTVAIAVLLLAGTSFAITWQETLDKAATSVNQIQSAKKQADASRWSYYRSLGSYLPQVTLSANSGVNYYPSGDANSYSYGISATQPLFRGFATTINMQNAFAQSQYDQASLKNEEAASYYQLRSAFIDVLVAQKNIDVQQKILAMRQENARMIKLLYDGGKEDQGNQMLTAAQVKEAEFQLESANRALDLAKFNLSQMIDTTVVTVEGELASSFEAAVDLNKLSEQSPSYTMSKYQLEMAELNKKAVISEFLPSVSLSGNLSNSGSDWPPQNTNKSISLNFSMPLFTGGTNMADYAIMSARLDKAREDFVKAEKDQLYALNSAYADYRDAIDNLAIQQRYLAASEERAKITQVKYLNGLASYNDWNSIQNEYITNQRNINNFAKTAMLAEANFKKAYGGWIK